MARNAQESAATTEAEVPAVEGAEGTPAEGTTTEKASRPKVILTLDEEAAAQFGGEVGQQVTRKDFILKLFGEKGIDRGPIAKTLTRLEGRNVPYQIVFQATKGVEKAKSAEEPAAEATPAE